MRKIPTLVMTCAAVAIATLVVRWPSPNQNGHTAANEQTELSAVQAIVKEPAKPRIIADQSDIWLSEVKTQLTEQLELNNYTTALADFDRAFERASSAELQQLHTLMINHAAKLIGESKQQSVIQLLSLYTQAYDEVDAWRLLANAYHHTNQWQAWLDALLRTNRLEIDASRFERNLRAIAHAASKLSSEHKSNNNPLAVRALYQSLYEQYPQHPRFQYELAAAHLALGNESNARPLLQALIFDPDLGDLAEQQLAALDSRRDSEQVVAQQDNDNHDGRQIVVPLIRAGTSLLVDARIEGNDSRLLLDTGASITALSTRRIQQLGLQPTGKSIRLNTANGMTTSRLYRAGSLSIGRVNFRNLIVAEINLSNDSLVDGLLGTDVLRKMNERYSYLIDDQQNALIFRARPSRH